MAYSFCAKFFHRKHLFPGRKPFGTEDNGRFQQILELLTSFILFRHFLESGNPDKTRFGLDSRLYVAEEVELQLSDRQNVFSK